MKKHIVRVLGVCSLNTAIKEYPTLAMGGFDSTEFDLGADDFRADGSLTGCH